MLHVTILAKWSQIPRSPGTRAWKSKELYGKEDVGILPIQKGSLFDAFSQYGVNQEVWRNQWLLLICLRYGVWAGTRLQISQKPSLDCDQTRIVNDCTQSMNVSYQKSIKTIL